MAILSRFFGAGDKDETQPSSVVSPETPGIDPAALVSLRDERIETGKGLKYIWEKDKYEPCPPLADNPFPDVVGRIPEINASEIDLQVLSGAIRHHGALIVRGLMDSAEASELREDIDRVMRSEVDDTKSEEDRSWFSIPLNVPEMTGDVNFARRCNSIFTFMSPRVSNKLLGYFERISLKSILKDYFNEDPCVSFKKSVLRRMEPTTNLMDWHQDGAFMTEEIASLNIWIALTECGPGTGAPGMKFIPKRLDGVIEETGQNGATMHWTVSQKSVDERFKGDESEVSPYFNEGDAIFFDHLNLHSTGTGPEFTKTRYAIETWFFGSSRHAENQISVAWT